MRIAIAGANGRMGRMLIETVLNNPKLQLTVALAKKGDDCIGQDAGVFLGQNTGIKITDDLNALKDADCLIDFTLPGALQDHLDACVKYGVKSVIGTTGFSDAQKEAIEQAGSKISIVFAPNMSVGVNVTLRLLDMAAKILNQDYDVEIFEAHHKHKIDAPSGTALAMGETIANAWGKDLNEIADWARHGVTGERKDGNIGFSVVRGGDIIGDHTAYFCGPGERIEITHKSNNRSTYAQGSVRAALFLKDKKTGVYNMQDVLNG